MLKIILKINIMNNDSIIDTDLTIVLQINLISENSLISTQKFAITRERTTGEKYFRQAIYVFNEEGKYVDSGFVQVNDYTKTCKMTKVCNKSKKYFHLYERWEHYKNNFNKSDKFNITDMITGNIIGVIQDTDVPNYVTSINEGEACFVGDLEKDEYSEVLLECLNDYSNIYAPEFPLTKLKLKEACGCELLEVLNGEVLDGKQIVNKSTPCNCKKINFKPELTEEQRIKKEKLKLQAISEIIEVFSKNGLLTLCF